MMTLTSILLFNSFLSLLFTSMFSPMSMGLILLIQTILVCTAAGVTFKSMWFSYILFLIFLGAMLVLFIYVASLASNQQFLLSFNLLLLLLLVFSVSLASILWLDPLLVSQIINVEVSSTSSDNILSCPLLPLTMIYSVISMNLTTFVILYLLLTLIVVVKITGFFYGPLRIS